MEKQKYTRVGFLVAAAFFLAAPWVWAAKNPDVLSRQCDADNNRKACQELAQLASDNKDFNVRVQAVSRLRDEAVLSRIADHDTSPPVRAAARKRLDDLRQGRQASNGSESQEIVVDLPEGASIKVRLDKGLSSESAEVGSPISLSVAEAVAVSGVIVIPRGSPVTGKVITSVPKRKMGRSGKLDFTIDSVQSVDQIGIPIRYTAEKGKGGNHFVRTGILTATFGPLGLLVHGKEATLPAGTAFDVYTDLKFTYNRSEKVLADERLSPDLRISAIPLVPNQAALARLIPSIRDPKVQTAAIEKVSDAGELTALLRNETIPGLVRAKFLPKITDMATLSDMFLTDSDTGFWQAAARLISDPAVLLAAARDTVNSARGRYAVGLISEPKLLAELARSAKDDQTALAAAEKVEDQELLGDIAMTSTTASARLTVVARLESELVLAQIAKNDKDEKVALAAEQRVKNPLLLVDIAKNSGSGQARQSALERVTDPLMIAQVARAATDDKVRALAIGKITDSNELLQLAGSDKILENRILAAQRITDDGAAYQLATTAPDREVRIEALRRISDQPSLARAIIDEKDPVVRRQALIALTQDTLLLEVARRDKSEEVQLAAATYIKAADVLAQFARSVRGADALLWQRAEALKTQAAYLDYLKLFPHGSNSAAARARTR